MEKVPHYHVNVTGPNIPNGTTTFASREQAERGLDAHRARLPQATIDLVECEEDDCSPPER